MAGSVEAPSLITTVEQSIPQPSDVLGQNSNEIPTQITLFFPDDLKPEVPLIEIEPERRGFSLSHRWSAQRRRPR